MLRHAGRVAIALLVLGCSDGPTGPATLATLSYHSASDGLVTTREDGTERQSIAPARIGGRYSRDGERIAFVGSSPIPGSTAERFDLNVVAATGGTVAVLTSATSPIATGSGYRFPTWTRDDAHLVFEASAERRTIIMRMPSDGGAAVTLIDVPRSFFMPHAVSPDGTELLLTEWRPDENVLDIVRANIDGTNRRVIYSGTRAYNGMDWSPDGRRIVFASTIVGGTSVEIIVRELASGRETVLTNDTALDVSPAWSPDGRRIAWSSGRGAGPHRIWIMNADGSNPVMIPNQGSNNSSPSWRP